MRTRVFCRGLDEDLPFLKADNWQVIGYSTFADGRKSWLLVKREMAPLKTSLDLSVGDDRSPQDGGE